MPFVHLQIQSAYSLLNSAVRIEKLVNQAKKLQYEALALTDENVMYGVIPFYKACKKAGIKPIIGLTLSILETEEGNSSYPLILLAQDQKGYENLLKLSSLVQTKEQNGVKKKWLIHYKEGLIAITPGPAGEIEQMLLENRTDEARRSIEFFQEVYGNDSFYLSIQRHQNQDSELNNALQLLATEYSLRLVATNQVKYINREDHDAYDCLTAIRDGAKLQDESRVRLANQEYYLKSQKEMEDLFSDQPDVVEQTVMIANRCNLELSLGRMSLPLYPVPSSMTADMYLQTLCEQGLQERMTVVTEEYKERLNYELQVIQQMRFSDYFLIVWDFMKYAHTHDIITGPGRGSAAGSLVSYALRITNVDPIKHQLLFERFLNPERISMPDIDIDFPDNKRDEVIQYVVKKYGSLHVAQIITFGTLAAKAAIRDVGKVMNIDKDEVATLSKLIPNKVGVTLQEAISQSHKLKRYIDESPTRRQLFEIAVRIEGLPRHTSTHAAGIVLSHEPLTASVPVQEGHHNVYLTQYPMEALQDIGLLKMDFLGLRNLTFLDHILKKVERDTGEKIILQDIPVNDIDTFKLLSKGDTTGIFQLESEGMRRVLEQLKPTELEDIVAVNALYRPGPMDHIPVYIRRKHRQEQVHYAHPDLEPILSQTYGVIVYQEQIMQIASTMAGFSLGEADLLRRAVSKKESEVLKRERDHFVTGSQKKGYDHHVAEYIYDLIVRFANYGFNRSHAVAYSIIAYQLAYLKTHYPLQFFSALLTSVIGNETKLAQYVNEIKKRKIPLLPPAINKSRYSFNVEKGGIRYSLAAIKHVGAGAVQEITNERRKKRFEDLFDFCMRISMKIVNKKTIESLIYAGCFDEFQQNRATLIATVDVAIEHAQLVHPEEADDFGFGAEFSLKPKYVACEELEIQQILEKEKEALGFYLSSHPSAHYAAITALYSITSICDFSMQQEGEQIYTLAFIANEKVIRTKQGEQMAFFSMNDETGAIDVVAFPRTYEKYRDALKPGNVVLVKGKLDKRQEKKQLISQEIALADELMASLPNQEVYLRIEKKHPKEKMTYDIHKIVSREHGNVPVLIYYEAEKRLIRLSNQYSVTPNPHLVSELKMLLGEENVVLKKI
ncbi:DNA polymerase III subunit alpha [Priestia megaterium]|nr:DNA polymerase III subunit alpha [Priestia megaterium]